MFLHPVRWGNWRKFGAMPKIVEIKGKKTQPKIETEVCENADAQIIIFPGVRYERTSSKETAEAV